MQYFKWPGFFKKVKCSSRIKNFLAVVTGSNITFFFFWETERFSYVFWCINFFLKILHLFLPMKIHQTTFLKILQFLRITELLVYITSASFNTFFPLVINVLVYWTPAEIPGDDYGMQAPVVQRVGNFTQWISRYSTEQFSFNLHTWLEFCRATHFIIDINSCSFPKS